MDFHSLTRKELQALCKQNKIPANTTNIAMADSLAALEHVEGLEQFLNQSQSGPQQLLVESETIIIGSPVGPQTSCRTSARSIKPVSKEEPESSQPLTRTRRATRREVAEAKVADQEAIEVPPETPAAPSTRRRALLVSAAKKTATLKDETSSVQRAYSTRRSVKLLEQTLEKLSLGEDVKIQTMKIDECSKEESANCSETADVKEVSLEKTEDGSPEIHMEVSGTVHEEVKDKECEDEDLKNLAESSDEKMDINETLVEEVIECVQVAKLSDESESRDFVAHQDLETDDSVSVEVSEEVKETVQTVSLNSIDSLEGQSECELEAASETESEKFVKSASEETLTEKSPAEDSTVLGHNYNGLNIAESEASLFNVDVVEAEVVELQSESVTEKLTDEDSFEEKETDENSHEEEETDLVEVEVIQLESVMENEIDEDSSEEEETDVEPELIQIRSETGLEKEIDEDSSEEEEETDEDSSEEESEDGDDDVDSEESELETPLVDHNVVKAKVAIPEEESAESDDKSITSLIDDVKAVQAEVTNNKSSPHSSVSVTKTPLPSPFAADQLSGQFPRPSLPTPAKPSTKSHPKIQMLVDDVLDENEEKTEVMTEENDKKGGPKFKDISLRQLQKMLKTKLQITKDNKAEKTRIALQTLPENCIAVDELQKDN